MSEERKRLALLGVLLLVWLLALWGAESLMPANCRPAGKIVICTVPAPTPTRTP